jgi:hypothetical protein
MVMTLMEAQSGEQRSPTGFLEGWNRELQVDGKGKKASRMTILLLEG